MFVLRWWHALFLVVGLTMCADSAMAQVTTPKPLSDVGGYTGQAMRQIYKQDVGHVYTIDSINAQDLRGARANVPLANQTASINRLSLGTSPGVTRKPFSSLPERPAVSPYMNLFRTDLDGGDDLNYQTLVQPQLRQQRVNEQVQRESMALSRRVQAISAQSAYSVQGSRQMYPTGHQTTFMYYGHYYPMGRR